MALTRALSTNNYGPAKFIVSNESTAVGTHSTISLAMASAVSGDTIFIRASATPYTENVTLTPGVNIAAYGSDSSLNATGRVIISGNITMTAAGTCTISAIQLQTNGAALLSITGSAASVVNLIDCYLNCTNNTGITFSSSSASSVINITNCKGNLGTTGIGLFSHSSNGSLIFISSDFDNTGGSSTANTQSAGSSALRRTAFTNPLTTSGTASCSAIYAQFDTQTQNVTCFTSGGSGACAMLFCLFGSGSASSISISNTTGLSQCIIGSSNTNAITGAGVLNYGHISFSSSSSNINTTTQNILNVGPSSTVGSSNSGNTNTLTITNSSNTATSASRVISQVAGTSATGDASFQSVITGGQTWSWGGDVSDSGRFKIGNNAALGSNTVLTSDGTNVWFNGISFDAGSNVMNSYVVGTFTPTMIGTVAGITTYSQQNGYYTRIGAIVQVQALVVGSAATGTGAIVLGGLPFTVKNQTGGNAMGAIQSSCSATWTFPAGTTSPIYDALVNGTNGTVWVNGSAGTNAQQQVFNATFQWNFNTTYEI